VPITQILADSNLFEALESRQDDQRVVGDYILLKALGGENGHVQLAIHKTTQKKVAVKTLKKDQMNEEELERARREIKIMEKLTQLDNPHIIKLIDWHETPTNFNLIVEYVSGGELVSLIKEKGGLTEEQSKRLFKQMVSALSCCHQQNIIHRDLKLQNILLDSEGNIKLIDFGLSNFVETGVFRNTFCGTPAFAPPEILLGTEYKGPEVDLWSLGVVLYAMITAEFPFKTVGEILKGKYAEPSDVSSECRDLLKRLLVVKKEDRLDVEGISKHPWLTRDDPALTGFSEAIDEPHVKRRRSC
jgi:serine/threonine protein kinase